MMEKSLPNQDLCKGCAALAKKYHAFGILSSDTNFMFFQIPKGTQIFSTENLNLETLETVKCDREELANHFGLQSEQLPLLATLKGNHLMFYKKLYNFQESLGNVILPHKRENTVCMYTYKPS